jgi:hypothetical protein
MTLSEEYTRLLREAYQLARGERMAQLRGRYLRRFNNAGLHEWSYIIGKLTAIEDFLELPNEVRLNHLDLQGAAIQEAHHTFAQRVREGREVLDGSIGDGEYGEPSTEEEATAQ